MISIYKEFKPVKYGLNIYSPFDKGSIGFKLRYWSNRMFHVRWSKQAKQWFISHNVYKDIG